jgi:hypothetical protein
MNDKDKLLEMIETKLPSMSIINCITILYHTAKNNIYLPPEYIKLISDRIKYLNVTIDSQGYIYIYMYIHLYIIV